MGTPLYMAPEQARGDPDVDHRADLHAVGVMLYEMLAGRPPYVGANVNLITFAILTGKPPQLANVAPKVPHDLADIVMKAIAPDRAARFASARELREALASNLRGETREPAIEIVVVPPQPRRPRAPEPSLDIVVEPPMPVWRAPQTPPRTEYLAPSRPAPARRPQAPHEQHALHARPLALDERRPSGSMAVVSGASSDYVHPATLLTESARMRRRLLTLLRLLAVSIGIAILSSLIRSY
jgi:serine/threonine protein kinase